MRCALGAVLAFFLAVAAVSPARAVEPEDQAFTRYAELESAVAFWRDVFTKYTKRQVVLHDPFDLDLVYGVRDLGHIVDSSLSESRKQRAIRDLIERESARIGAALKRVEQGASGDEESQRLAALLALRKGSRASATVLANRIRGQRGLGDELCGAVDRAHDYLPEMRRILASHGVPPGLAHLPLVESSYRTVAHSHAGAVGVWQFTRGTGRRFLHIDHAVDERLDTLLATEAAAKYLRENYDRLGTWPLAITAYNHGANGMSYAVRRLGTTNLATIVERYKSPQFGFASRNFYAEFLAANEVMSHAERYCGPTIRPAIARDTVVVSDYVAFAELARSADTDPQSLAAVNPALARDVINGRLRVPKGYRLTLPADRAKDAFLLAYAALPSGTKSGTQARYYATHRVQRGQTLSGIATQYRTSVAAIERHNHIADPRRLRTGQVLNIPVAASAPVVQPASLASAPTRRDDPEVRQPGLPGVADGYRTHRVSRGQTLTHIARIYRTTVSLLQRHNGISDPRKLRNGQVLKIPR
jgi:membrane-bound lytic murein transglycosylase D